MIKTLSPKSVIDFSKNYNAIIIAKHEKINFSGFCYTEDRKNLTLKEESTFRWGLVAFLNTDLNDGDKVVYSSSLLPNFHDDNDDNMYLNRAQNGIICKKTDADRYANFVGDLVKPKIGHPISAAYTAEVLRGREFVLKFAFEAIRLMTKKHAEDEKIFNDAFTKFIRSK